MSWSLSKIVGLIIVPLLVAATILGAYQEIRTGPLEDNKRDSLSTLRKEARHMVVGVNPQGEPVDEEVAKEQFRELVIYSQISAMNCNLLYYIHARNGSGDKLSEYIRNGKPSKIQEDLSDADKMIKYSIPGRDNGPGGPGGRDHSLFNYLAHSQYVPTCIGTGNKVPNTVNDKRVQEMREGDLIGTAIEGTVGTALGALDDAWNAASCKIAPGWAKSRGNDMEGKFGKITFETEKRILLDYNKIWSVNALWDEESCDTFDNENFYGNKFWAGGEWMNFLPYPDSGNPQEWNYHTNSNSPPFSETNSALMDAIIDAPVIVDENLVNGEDNHGNFPKNKVSYVICEGAEGSVQTNAQNMTNEGESVFGSSPYSRAGEYKGNTVKAYTFIEINKGAKSCVKNVHDQYNTYYGTYHNGESCNTFEEATKTNPDRTGGAECGLLKDKYYPDDESDGKLTTFYKIGWIG